MKNKIAFSTLLTIVIMISGFSALATTISPTYAQPVDGPTLDPLTIPKYVNQLVIPPVYVPKNVYDSYGRLIRQEYRVTMSEFYQQILPSGFPTTLVWGYGGYAKDAVTGKYLGFVRNSPAPSFEATRGIPVRVTWVNHLTRQMLPVDPTLHWANPNNMPMMVDYQPFPPGYAQAQAPVPTVVHLHGGEVPSAFDGGPEQWFTANGIHGPDYRSLYSTSADSAVYQYPNTQMPATLWYHDHALGITRINVMSGLAGFYILRDKNPTRDHVAPRLPKGKYEIPLAIQDRSFNLDGSLWFPSVGVNTTVHPYWNPEFFGNTIMVNGKVWPNLNVDRGQYRFRVLDGSNARFYNLTLMIQGGGVLPFTLIGTDGGYIKSAVNLNSILIAPGQRDDILVDFSRLARGTKIIMANDAAAPFPMGDASDPNTVGQIMQFTVTSSVGRPAVVLPAILNPTLAAAYPTLHSPDANRMLPFFEVTDQSDNPLGVFLTGQKWAAPTTEMPRVGSTEDWWFINPTGDAHPMHTHLTQFQLVYRIPFNATAYTDDWITLNGMPPLPTDQTPTELSVLPYLTGAPEYPTAQEIAWRDTIITPPGYVTVIRVRFAPQDQPTTGLSAPIPGINTFSFDPTSGPGYVWHCHIVDHEDNEMMRRYRVTNSPNPVLSVKVYDMDAAGEFQVLVNGKLVFKNPTDPTKNNIWTALNLDIAPYVGSGSNVIVFKNPTWAYCKMAKVQIIINGIKIINDPTATPLQHSQKKYTFNI